MIDPPLREDGPQITDRLLRQFAGLCVLLFGALSLIDRYVRHRPARAVVFLLLAAAIGIVGLVRPRAMHLVFHTAMALTKPIGWVVSRVLLAVMFYVVFTPIALIFRMTGRDALARRFNAGAATYWRKRSQPTDIRGYLHQS
jgi:hypothetical protein